MIELAIAALPNQTFFAQLEDRAYTISLRSLGPGVVTATIVRDDVTLITGARMLPGAPLLPYRYQEVGNFILITNEGALPDYAQFGVTQFLAYLTADELAAMRA